MSHHWLIAMSMGAHIAVAGGLFASNVWELERLGAPKQHLDLVQPLTLPAPAAGGAVVARLPEIRPKITRKKTVRDTVQPDHRARVETTPVPTSTGETTTGTGAGSGEPTDVGACLENCAPSAAEPDPVCGNGAVELGEACDDGNLTGGDGCSATCAREVKPPPQNHAVIPSVLQGLRLSGDTQLHPDTATQNLMLRDGAARTVGVVKLCIGTDGSVASTRMLSSTRYPGYDQTLLSAVRTWRYRPYTVNGAPVPACSTVSFVYTIR